MTQETGDGASGGSASVEPAGDGAFDALAAALEEGAYRLDVEGRFEAVNDAFVDLLGYDREELVGDRFAALVAAEDVEAVETAIRGLRDGDGRTGEGTVGEVEASLEAASGERVPCSLRIAAVEADGRFAGAAGSLRVVADRRHEVEVLERERDALQSELDEAMDRVSDAFFAADAEGRFTYVNERAGALLERDPEALVGADVVEELPGSADTPFVENAMEVVDAGEPVTFEEFYAPLSRWFRVRVYPSETGVSVYFRDVTGEKRRESVLEQYETVVEAVDDGLYAVDEDYRFTFVNDAYCELTGYDREELLGEHISAVVDEETTGVAQGLRDDMLASDEESGSVEVEIVRADAERVTVEVSYAVVPDEEEFRGTVGVVRDVSERKAFEEMLAALNEAARELQATETDDDIADVVLGALTDVLGLPTATLFRRDDGEGVLVPERQTVAAAGSGQELPELPAGEGSLTGHVLETGEFHAFEDIRETAYLDEPETEMRAGLMAPLSEDRVLVVSSPEPGAFDERTERLVEILAGNAAAALERQERERELRESERRYRMLVDNFPNGAVALYDEACTYVAVGGQMYDRIDLSPEDAVGKTVGERLSGGIAETLESLIDRAFDGETGEAEAPYDGRDFRLQSLPIRDDDGDVLLAMVVTQDVTERKQAEEALAESERRFRTMMEQSPLSTQIFDPDGNVVMVNPAWEELWGASSEDLGEYNVLEDEQLEEKGVMPYLERGFEGEATQLPTVHYDPAEIGREGRSRWIEAFVYPVFDEAGEIREVVLIHNDVTESRERERELERYETIVETVDDGVYAVDAENRFVLVNDAYCEIVGREREELLGSTSATVVGEGTVAELEEMAEAATDSEIEDAVLEIAIERPDGETVTVETRFAPYPTEDGFGRMGVIRDVTERKERERELAEQRERYRGLVENAPVPIGIYDAGGRLTFVNDAAVELMGADGADDLVGESAAEFIHPDERAEAGERMQRVIEEREPAAPRETTLVSLDGEVRHVVIASAPITQEGEPAAQVVLSDVTERREYERALEESEQRYRTLIENFPNGAVALVDQSLRYQTVGGSPLEVAGATIEELQGTSVEEALPPELADELVPRYEAALGGDAGEFEAEFDGQVYQFHVVPVRDDDGEVFAALGMSQEVTERKEYERALQERERRLSTLMDNVPGMVYRCRNEGGWPMTFVSDGCRELTGYDPAALERGEVSYGEDVVHEEDREGLWENVQRSLAADEPFLVTYRIVTADGEVRWVRERGRQVVDQESGTKVLEGVIMDVTEHREYERALEESEQRYRTLVESYPDGAVAMFDSDLRYTVAGGQLLEAQGVDPEERVGKSIFELYPEELIDEVEPHFRAALDGETNSFEVRYSGLDLFNYTLPVESADGEVLGGMLVVNDVTEQREYERTLERFQTIIETVEDGVYTIDSEGHITMVNAAYAEMVGYHRDELIGMHATELVDEDVAERAREIETELAEGGSTTARLVADLNTADDRTVKAEATFALLPGEDEEYERVAVVRDVTERFEREAELERALDLLHHTEDVADVGGWEIDPETMEVYWTEELFDILGVPYGEEPPIDEALDVYHPDDRPVVAEAIDGALEAGEPIDVEVRFTAGDGDEPRWGRIQGIPTVEDGEVVSLRGAFQDITERVERERELRERIEQEDVVTELGTFALEEPDLERLFDRATDLVAETLDNDLCKLLELEADGETLALRAGRGWDDGLVGSATIGTGDDSIAGRTLRTEEAIVVDDIEAEDPTDRPDLLTDHGGRSGVSVIVGSPQNPWGVLGTYDTGVREFSQQDVNFVQSVANILAIAIERASREAELHRRVEQQQVVTDLGKRALEDVDLDSLLEEAVERVAETLDNEYAKVLELLPDGESLLLRSGVGWRDGLVGEGTVGSGDDSQAGHTIRSEEPIVVTDLATEERFSGPELLTDHGVRSGVSTIVGPHDDPWGVLGTHDTERREFSQQDVNFVQSVANILATAIDRRTREREIEQQRNRMAAIVRLSEIVQEVDQAVIEQSSREEIDRLVCEHLVDSGEYTAAWVGDVNLASQTVAPRAVAGLPEGLIDAVSFDADGDGEEGEDGDWSPTGSAAATGESRIARAGDHPNAFPEVAEERGFRSMAAVPLAFEDVRYGVLTLYSTRESAFEGYERAVLEQLGRTVGHAINAIDRKQALVGDSYTELEIRLPGVVEALDFGDGGEHSITVEGTVPASGDRMIQYLTVAGIDPEDFLSVAQELPSVGEVRKVGGDGPSYRYEVTYEDPPITGTLTSYGGRVESIRFDVPDLCITAAMPPSADVRQIVGTLRSEFPELRIDAQRTVTREHTGAEEHRTAIEDALTERQRTALMTAFFAGYFEWSRESTGEEVAETLGVSPSTFHQHLRAAQRKVLSALFEDDRVG